MALEIKFQLHDRDLEHFRDLFIQAREKAAKTDPLQILQATRSLVASSLAKDPPDFIRDRLKGLSRLVTMVEDDAWRLPDEERKGVIDLLTYFVAPDDLIPDAIPVLGLLDDAIAAELVLRGLRHELEAYEEFSRFRATEAERLARAGKPTGVSKEDWLAERRAKLHSRMRERRVADPLGWRTPWFGY